MAGLVVAASNGATVLVGASRSTVLTNTFVAIAAFVSNTIDASWLIAVLVGRAASGRTTNDTNPSPTPAAVFGGRKPSAAPAGNSPLAASTLRNVQVTVRLPASRATATVTDSG